MVIIPGSLVIRRGQLRRQIAGATSAMASNVQRIHRQMDASASRWLWLDGTRAGDYVGTYRVASLVAEGVCQMAACVPCRQMVQLLPMAERAGSERFHTTRWSVVKAASGNPRSREAREALASLSQAYWFPIYSFIRRQGHSPQDAEDLTQEFVTRLIEKNYLADVDSSKGRFRNFLLACLRHFLLNEYDRVKAQKRGGGKRLIELDALAAEKRYQMEPATHLSADRLFDRRWAIEVLDRTLLALRIDYGARGQQELFDAIRHVLQGSDGPDHATLAAQLQMTPGAVKVAVSRLRARYRELLREEVSQTVSSDEELRAEMGELLACL